MGANGSRDFVPIESEDELERLLQQLDTRNNGYLLLDDVLNVPTAWAFINSLPLLFYFDELKDGCITFDSLKDAYMFFKRSKGSLRDELTETEYQELMKRGSSLAKQTRENGSSCNSANGRSLRRLINLTNVRSVFVPEETRQEGGGAEMKNESPDPETGRASASRVKIYGQQVDGFSKEQEDDDNLKRKDSETLDESFEHSEHAITTAVGERVRLKMFKELTVFLSEDGAREEFMQWLWKIVDFGKQNYITLAELSHLLHLLEYDNIYLSELAFSQRPGVSPEERIMSEFDATGTGVLTGDHFIILADLITREYEYWESRHLESVGNCELGRIIGKGATGIVRFASNIDTHERYALKIVKKGNCAYMSRLDHEIESLKMLANHPHVVKLEEVLEDDENMYLRMELLGGGSLIDIVRLYPCNILPEEVARYYMRQLFETLSYCHSIGVCHRDVRLENMLLDNDAQLKLGDFGQSGVFTAAWDMFSTTLVGSIYSLSPEQVLGMCYSGRKIDVWSAGVSMYCLLVGHPPFYDLDSTALLTAIVTGTYETPVNLSAEAINLMQNMINVDPDARPSFAELLKHPWFTMGGEIPPVLDLLDIPVHPLYVRRPDLAEMIIARELYPYTHFHLGEVNKNDLPESVQSVWCIKCHYPSLDLKFLLTMCTRPKQKDKNEEAGPETDTHVQDGFQVARDSGWPNTSSPSLAVENSALTRTLSQYPYKRHVATTAPGVVPQLRSTNSFGSSADSRFIPNTVSSLRLDKPTTSNPDREAFLSVAFQEGEKGTFVKICRQLKSICDEHLWDAAEEQRKRRQERDSLVRESSDSSALSNAVPTRQ